MILFAFISSLRGFSIWNSSPIILFSSFPGLVRTNFYGPAQWNLVFTANNDHKHRVFKPELNTTGTLTLKMTIARAVDISVAVNNNSPIPHYAHPDDHASPTYGFVSSSRMWLARITKHSD